MSFTTTNTSITFNGSESGQTNIISVAGVNRLGTGSYTSITATG